MRQISLVLAVLFLIGGGYSSQAKDKGNDQDLSHCLKSKVKGYGFPNKMRSVANMNAIIQWMSAIKKKHGAEYAQWHTAMESKVECRRSGTDLHTCHAEALPCKPKMEVSKNNG